jgi:drug/metabolite transporter (DMT)-like permease
VAHTLLIIASAPILTAVLARLILGERLRLRTWLAGAGVLAGIVLIFWSSLGSGRIEGDLLALSNTVVLAFTLIALRRYQEVNTLLALAASGFLVAAVVSPWGARLGDAGSMTAAALDGLIFVPGGLALMSLAPRYLPAAEVSLVILLETILAPIWVWLGIGEPLTLAAVLSGAVILTAISIHSIMDLRDRRRRADQPLRA